MSPLSLRIACCKGGKTGHKHYFIKAIKERILFIAAVLPFLCSHNHKGFLIVNTRITREEIDVYTN